MSDSAASTKMIRLADLKPDEKNANKGTPRGNQMIEDSLRRYGAGRSILLDKHGNIIAGNKTAENAGAIGMEGVLVVQSDGSRLVAVQRTDLDIDDPRTRQLAIADNRAAQVSLDWDAEALKGLADDGVDLAPFWTKDELADMWPLEPASLLTGDDDVPETPEEPRTKPGDLYVLGHHRLLCGDSTCITDVERLMGGRLAACMWTDPPYGVNYTGKTKDVLKIKNDAGIDLRELLNGAFSCATIVLQCGAAVYVAHPAGALNVTFGVCFLDAGWRLHQTLIWDKGTIVLGHSDYHFSHEPIFYGYTPGDGRFGRGGKGWYGDDSQRSVLQFPKPSRNESHPTMKPVALVEYCLGNSSRPGDVVLDLFGGSGSTLIACEKTGRKCFMMELDPRYCDVIVTRWERATGKKAILHGANTEAD